MNAYSEQDKEIIKSHINSELEKAIEVNSLGKGGTPVWMNILFILETFNQGNFYGTLELKVLGTTCNDVKIKERTYKLREKYGTHKIPLKGDQK